jgi:hypothetical protein
MAKQGAIGALIAFVIGVWFAIPSQANLGLLILDALSDGLPLSTVVSFKIIFILLGIVIIISDIAYIISQFKKRNY